MIYTATGPDGEFTLPAPVSVRFDRDEDAPADGFAGVFQLLRECGRLTGIAVRDSGGNVCFDGVVDEQDCSLGGGPALSLSARGRAALLLDNEAQPQNYANPSLPTIFERHIRPYGFTGFLGGSAAFSGSLSVTKGMSEWAAAAAFCKAYLNTVPRVNGTVFDASGSAPETEIRFGTGGIPVSSAEFQNKYSELLSEIYLLKSDGSSYALAARSAAADALGIRRRRFLSNSSSDAAAVLERAEKKAFAAVLDCPGEVSVPLLSPASVRLPGLGTEESLVVSGVRYLLDAGGEHTTVTLRRK